MRLLRILFLFLVVCVSFIPVSEGQEFIHYNLTDGLSGIEVTDIKENKNFLWIATSDGLNRFDGTHFKVFRHESDNPNSLAENYTECLFFDSEGLLWIGLKSGGADIYDPKKEQFIHLRDVIDLKVPVRVISILEDSQGNIWLGTWEEGVYKLTPVKGSKRSYTVQIHYPGYIVSSIVEKPSGFVRVGTYFGFFTYDMNRKIWVDSEHQNISVTQFYDSGTGNDLWCSTWNSGLIRMEWDKADTGRMYFREHYKGSDYNAVFRIAGDAGGSLFLGTWGNGIRRLDPGSPTGRSHSTSGEFSNSLINALYLDVYNNLWAGTYGEGIIRFSDATNGLKHYPSEGELPAPATALAAWGDSKILVGTQGSGMYLLDLAENRISPVWANSDDGNLKNYILSLYANRDYLFIGHDGDGIPYSVDNNKFEKEVSLKTYNNYPATGKVTAFYYSDAGTVWIGTKQDGLSSFSFNTITGFPENFVHYDNFGRDEITGFAEYNDTTLLISSHSGLFRFNTQTGRTTGNLSGDLIYRILDDRENNCLWIGTSANVFRLNYDDPEQKIMPAFPGYELHEGAVRSMTRDNNNNLWFSVGGRLMCYLHEEKDILELNQALLGDHAILSSTEVNSGEDELLVFGTTDNLIVINPDKLLTQDNTARIVFSELQIDHRRVNAGDEVFGNVVMGQASEYTSSINLSYKCRWISLGFIEAGADMFVNRYHYNIKGFTDEWQNLDLTSPVTFSQLNPGQYTLRIRRYNNGSESPVVWSMVLNVIPPWWKTGWSIAGFIALSIVIVLLSAIMVTRYNRKKQAEEFKRIEREKEDELLREKESFFTGLSHDLMTPFSLIMSPANDLLREYQHEDPVKEKLRIIRKNASYLSDIFGTILDFKRAELSDDDVRETQIEAVAFARMIVNAFEYLANSRRIRLSYSANVSAFDILTDNVKLERILFNLISNAMKFTPDGGKVDVVLSIDHKNMLSLVITDNGSGIDMKKQARVFEKFYRETEGEFHRKNKGLGLGLYIVRKFTDRLNGTINVRSSPGEGTEISVTIPVKTVAIAAEHREEEKQAAFADDKSTVLIVEDNAELRDYIRNKMAPYFNIFTADNGSEALTTIDTIMPEIIITDIMMPGMDGLSLTQTIKSNDQYADIFVVILTALVSTDNELEGYKKGADLYIKKPFDGEVLLKQMINIHTTRLKRKKQIMSWLVSGGDHTGIEFDSRDNFLKRSMQVIEEHIMEADFKINEFAAALNVSKTVLHRKFRLLAGQTPNQFIRLIRLRKAVHLLQHTDHHVAEIAYLTGFNQSHYFIKCFREVYNKTPGEFRSKSNP